MPDTMTILIILLLLAVVFGAGAILEGLLWLFLLSLVVLVAAGWFGWTKIRGVTRSD